MVRPDWSMTWLNRAILHRDEGNLATASADIQRTIELIGRELDRFGLQMLHLVHSSSFTNKGK
jgi:hypothetical protein